jgi:hypothetical protein
MNLTQTTYRLWLRTGINHTGYGNDAAITAAINALVANVIPVTPTNGKYDLQD